MQRKKHQVRLSRRGILTGLFSDALVISSRPLREHQKRMLAEGRIAAPVFCDTRGGHLRISNLRKNSFNPVLARAKLPHSRLYDLRHTCATLLLLADESPKVVSEHLGHASVQLTLDTYSHVLPTMQRRAADKMNQILRHQPARAAN